MKKMIGERTVWEVKMSMPGQWDWYEAWALVPEGVAVAVDSFMHNDPCPDMVNIYKREVPVLVEMTEEEAARARTSLQVKREALSDALEKRLREITGTRNETRET